ncbi:BstXI family restriction endonuclease [Dokdonella sp.]|uniref:BstXI family restriction endonuclease n=1 Tax=Dokdonella sp. TaxID=2291710 RepID=UPI0031C0D039|nr:BstXI family restriction endonuclease [Dokdonella sp.]
MRPPRLPQLLDRKIYKAGQTRGADDDVIYQNRVSRNSTVLIPYHLWDEVSLPPQGENNFLNGFICLIRPADYFGSETIENDLANKGLTLGENALVFYQTRSDWDENNPENMGWIPANNRTNPLGGQYVARIAATTAANNGEKISRGFNTTGMKGAGIRLFEYASPSAIDKCRVQLEAIFWLCHNSIAAVSDFEMSQSDATTRKNHCLNLAEAQGLLDYDELVAARLINEDRATVCPLCLEPLSGYGFFSRLAQALGREVHDLTVTEINLFHIKELRYGQYNHRPYNLGWGHHHCNVVVKDSGIDETLMWMSTVLNKNRVAGYFEPQNNDA